jgi:hypothetical protein
MAREAVFMVGLVALGALFALAVQIARLRTRVLGHERAGAELSRTVAAVQGWAARELRALRDEFTGARVDASAAPGRPPEPDDDEPRDTLAMLAPASPARRSSNEDGEETTFLEPVQQRT